MRAVAYARLSTDRQNESGIQDQLAACRRFAESRGWTVVDEVAEEGYSGASRHNRPGLLGLMDRIDSWDVLLCWSSSRLARNQEDLGWISNRLRAHRRTGYETSTSLELLNVGARVMGALHEEYLHQLREDTRRGLLGRATQGLATGGTPYGYRSEAVSENPAAGRRLVVDLAEAAIVRRIFNAFVNGAGLRAIAHELNAEGVPSPRARAHRGRRPTWSPTAIREMLRRHTYVGEVTFNRSEWVKDHATGKRRRHERPAAERVTYHDPDLVIVDADTFDRAQGEHSRRRPQPRTSDGRLAGGRRGCAGPARFALSGALACGVCGGGFCVQTGSTYGCSWHRGRDPAACSSALRVPRAELESRVFGALRELLTPEVVAYAIERAATIVQAATASPAPDPRLAQLDADLVDLRRMAARGIDVAAAVRDLERQRAGLTRPAGPMPDLDALRPAIERHVHELRGALEASPQSCRAALRALLAGERLQVRADAERGFAVEGFVEVRVPGSRGLDAEPGRSGGGI